MFTERIRDHLHQRIARALEPLARRLSRLGVSANQVTIAGPWVNLAAAALILADWLVTAGVVYLAAGVLDLLDGVLARIQDNATRFGAFLDSTFDRISEGLVFSAIAYYFAARGDAETAALVVLALLGSLLTSYTRARAEALGARCKAGIVTRAERILLVVAGLWFGVLQATIYLLVVLTAITVAQRVRHTFRELTPEN